MRKLTLLTSYTWLFQAEIFRSAEQLRDYNSNTYSRQMRVLWSLRMSFQNHNVCVAFQSLVCLVVLLCLTVPQVLQKMMWVRAYQWEKVVASNQMICLYVLLKSGFLPWPYLYPELVSPSSQCHRSTNILDMHLELFAISFSNDDCNSDWSKIVF